MLWPGRMAKEANEEHSPFCPQELGTSLHQFQIEPKKQKLMSRGVSLLLWEPGLLLAHTAGLSLPPLLSHLLPKVPYCLKNRAI